MGKKIGYVSGLGTVWGAYQPDVLDRRDCGTVGGGEAAMLHTAFGLAKRGHQVTVYYPGDAGVHRNVQFRPYLDAFTDVALGRHDIVVGWSHSDILRIAPPGVRRVFSQQLNDLPVTVNFWNTVDALVSPAQTHMDFMLERFAPGPFPKERTHVVPNGVDLALYQNPWPWETRPPWVGYWSSPDRGLHHLLTMWSRIRQEVPKAELHIFYHMEKYIRSFEQMFNVQEACWRSRQMRQLLDAPGIVVHGPISRMDLAPLQQRTRVQAYPFDPVTFTEGFGIALLEGYAAGCHVVARPGDALQEVHKDAVEWISGSQVAGDPEYQERFVCAVVAALREQENPFHARGVKRAAELTWDNAAALMEGALLS